MPPPAARLIATKATFAQGTCCRNLLGEPCSTISSDAAVFDCLGAILYGYRLVDSSDRHTAAKRAFDLCQARYGHKRLGRLHWEEALEILTDAGV